MNLYEHTIIARQDTSPTQIKQLQEKYSKIVEKNEGDIVKLENWGLMNLSYLIKKNKKGNYIHFKIKADGKTISELEKSEKIDKSVFQNQKYKFKKKCPLSGKGAPVVDYKNIKLLKRYVSENGKILPSRITSVSQKKQRELSLSIKRARNLALI